MHTLPVYVCVHKSNKLNVWREINPLLQCLLPFGVPYLYDNINSGSRYTAHTMVSGKQCEIKLARACVHLAMLQSVYPPPQVIQYSIGK